MAAAAWRDTYAGLLKSETIERFIERAYSPERVASRITEDQFYVAEDSTGIVAFADALEREDRLDVLALYALPDRRNQGAGTALLRELLSSFPANRFPSMSWTAIARAKSSTSIVDLRVANG